MNLWFDGQPREVVVDDQIPWDLDKNQFAFSYLKDSNEVWLQILEKALAKVFGSYMRLENGESGEVFSIITGAPSLKFKNKDDLSVFKHFPDMLCSAVPRKLKGKGLTSQPGNCYQIVKYLSDELMISNPFLESLKGENLGITDFSGDRWI